MLVGSMIIVARHSGRGSAPGRRDAARPSGCRPHPRPHGRPPMFQRLRAAPTVWGFALLLVAAVPAAADQWNDMTDAINKLFGARQGAGGGGSETACDNYNGIAALAQTSVTNTGSN